MTEAYDHIGRELDAAVREWRDREAALSAGDLVKKHRRTQASEFYHGQAIGLATALAWLDADEHGGHYPGYAFHLGLAEERVAAKEGGVKTDVASGT